MNSYERYMTVLKGGTPDILPRIPIVMQFAAEHIGSDYAKFASDYRVLVDANEACARDYGFDQISCISDPYRETQGFGAAITYVSDGPPRSTHPLSESKDLRLLSKPNPLVSPRMLDRVQAAGAYNDRWNKQYSILGWVEGPAAEAADLRDVTPFLMDLIEDESFAADLMDACLDTAIAFARAQVAAGTDTVGIGDAIASQVSPDIYERLIQPREKILIRAIQGMGAWVRLHICGNITSLLPAIADLHPDILDVDHMVDMGKVRRAVGRQVAIAGNLDPVSVVREGTPEQIRAMLGEIYEQVGNPLMVNAGCEIPSGTPGENLRALCEPIAYKHAL